MIYLSQLILNPASRMVQSECQNPYEMHRTLMHGFANKRRETNVLYRLDIHPYSGMMALLVQSTIEPDWQPLSQVGQWEYLLAPPQWKAVELDLPNGRSLQFRLTANPTIKKVRRDEHGQRQNSNRVPLVHEAAQIEWLQKQAAAHGFRLLDLAISQPQRQTGWQKDNGRPLTLYTVQYNGRLQITDATQFTHALHTGIGPAKAFGCGLLSLAPA
jgi:CRISPR system Cascade subunit CasE